MNEVIKLLLGAANKAIADVPRNTPLAMEILGVAKRSMDSDHRSGQLDQLAAQTLQGNVFPMDDAVDVVTKAQAWVLECHKRMLLERHERMLSERPAVNPDPNMGLPSGLNMDNLTPAVMEVDGKLVTHLRQFPVRVAHGSTLCGLDYKFDVELVDRLFEGESISGCEACVKAVTS